MTNWMARSRTTDVYRVQMYLRLFEFGLTTTFRLTSRQRDDRTIIISSVVSAHLSDRKLSSLYILTRVYISKSILFPGHFWKFWVKRWALYFIMRGASLSPTISYFLSRFLRNPGRKMEKWESNPKLHDPISYFP